MTKPKHIYWSTGCQHNVHEHCKNDHTISGLPKKPHTCKFCDAECLCVCHNGIDVSALTDSEIQSLTLEIIVKNAVGSYHDIDYTAVETILGTLNHLLRHAGNPWGDSAPPEHLQMSLDHAVEVTDSLRNLL
jgi:hypothetical protein